MHNIMKRVLGCSCTIGCLTFKSWIVPKSRCHSTISTAIGSRKNTTLDPDDQLNSWDLSDADASVPWSWQNWNNSSLLIVKSFGWMSNITKHTLSQRTHIYLLLRAYFHQSCNQYFREMNLDFGKVKTLEWTRQFRTVNPPPRHVDLGAPRILLSPASLQDQLHQLLWKNRHRSCLVALSFQSVNRVLVNTNTSMGQLFPQTCTAFPSLDVKFKSNTRSCDETSKISDFPHFAMSSYATMHQLMSRRPMLKSISPARCQCLLLTIVLCLWNRKMQTFLLE